MKVFVSWSGEKSRAVAEVVRRWLPSVLQAVRPYFSPDDVTKGARWSAEIAKELEVSRIGLLIITPQNQDAPWLLFEAGALAKNLDRTKVCPLLFGGMEATDVKGPLVQFQATQFSKEEIKRVVKMMNSELAEAGLSSDVLDNVFDMWWPELEKQVKEALEGSDESDDEARRSERDLLEEVLALTRRLARDGERRFEFDHPAWDDMLIGVAELVRVVRARSQDEETTRAIRRLMGPLGYFARRELPRGRRLSSRPLMREIESLLDAELAQPAASTAVDESTP